MAIGVSGGRSTGRRRPPALDGRPRFGRRRPEWAAFEDKTNSVELLADAGALPATVEVVPNTTEDIVAAVTASPSRHGVVVAGDMATGHSGFAEDTRAVHEPSEVGTIPGCERVRVMPFLAGVPIDSSGAQPFSAPTLAPWVK